MRNLLNDFFVSSTELHAIDYFFEMVNKNNLIEQRFNDLTRQLNESKKISKQKSEENRQLNQRLLNLEDKYKIQMNDLNKKNNQSYELEKINTEYYELRIKLQQIESLKNNYSINMDNLVVEKNVLEKKLNQANIEKQRIERVNLNLKLKNEEADKQSILLSEKISRMEKQNNSGVPKNKDFNSDLQNMELNQTISSDSLNDFQKGVWTDPETGLMWSRISIGQQWVDGKCKGIATHVDWKQAEELCKEMRLGKFYDWRLPTINELHTLMIKDRKGYTANTNLLFQPNIGIWGFYWSSKQIMPKVAQGVDFDTGCIAKCNYFDFRGYVRAVRKSCEASK